MRAATALVLVSTLLFAACGDDQDPASSGSDTVPPPTTTEPVANDDDPGTTDPPETTPDSPGDDGEAEPRGEELAAELAAARQRWAALERDSYSMELTVECFCLLDYVGPFDVTVVDGTVSEVAYAPGARAEVDTPPANANIVTIDEIFDMIDDAIGTADEVRVSYDPDTGVPTSVWIDREFEMADEEIGFSVVLDPER
jgi:hypothetical protein